MELGYLKGSFSATTLGLARAYSLTPLKPCERDASRWRSGLDIYLRGVLLEAGRGLCRKEVTRVVLGIRMALVPR